MGNVALNKPAEASLSVAPYSPNRAVDGVTSAIQRWVGAVPGWLQVDLGYPYWINKWTVKNMAVIAGWDNYVMKDYALQGSDDTKIWANINRITNNSSSTTQVSINPCRYRYFRTVVNTGLAVNNAIASIVDMELEEYNNPPYLSALSVSQGSLNPGFYKQIFNYSVTVGENVNEIYVVPATTAANATITVNGSTVNNSTPSQNIALSSAVTTISIVVTINGTNIMETYTITVLKNVSPYLDNLEVSDAILSETFDPYITDYLAYVDNSTTAVSITAYTHTPGAFVNIGGKTYSSGQNTGMLDLTGINTLITVYVENASPQINYQITVQKES